jgi:hypothetical protein
VVAGFWRAAWHRGTVREVGEQYASVLFPDLKISICLPPECLRPLLSWEQEELEVGWK